MKGVRQEENLSPFLFAIFLNEKEELFLVVDATNFDESPKTVELINN